MRAHSPTIDQKSRIGVTVDVGGLEWFHRLCQWFRGATQRQREIGPVSPYGAWDAQHERFRPQRAEAAVDIVASQNSTLWSTKIHSISI
jgi:hypothetical protein